MKRIFLTTLALPVIACAQPVVALDPAGILRKPIPDKLVVLTFDDACASGYTVVAPILKSFGFNGSFHVCDFDSFKTRKDWYMTYRQMKALADAGFEIGNHSAGHSSGFDAMMAMEDQLLANHVPKPTTIAWPLHNANVTPELSAAGYIFARGGHNRAYRPTVDNPFEIPSMWCNDLDGFVKMVRQAAGGKIVTICYHGVPDMEHPPVSLAPEVFKVQMQYLKDNHYKVIALRDLAEYIDPAKAAKLPPTARDFKDLSPVVLAAEEKPCGEVVTAAKSNAEHEKNPLVRKSNDMLITHAPAVKAISSDKPNVFTWNKAEAGNWSDGAKWSNNLSNGSAPLAVGQLDYVFNFNQPGKYIITHDLDAGFMLNRLNLGIGNGNALTLTGIGMKFTGTSPCISQSSGFTSDKVSIPMNLANDIAVNLIAGGGRVELDGLISGVGGLVYTGGNGNASGDLNGGPNKHYSTLSINNPTNTYSGGTIINGGTLRLAANTALGTGPVTLNEGAGFAPGQGNASNALILNGGTIDAGNLDWNASITLNGNTRVAGHHVNFNNVSGAMTGPGGFTVVGTWIAFARGNDSELSLWGTNTYTGPTSVQNGALFVKRATALYNADSTQWIPAKISVHPTATLALSVGGAGEFSGEQIGTLLNKLTAVVNNNGLMERATLCLDTSNAREPVTVTANIADSKGPGGGSFLLKKFGAGTLQISGNNTYTGQTLLESGALSVTSLNSFTKGMGKPSSSLGAPTDIESGEIIIGEEGKDGECALIYTGTGESSDRVMNLAGKTATVTLDQSGTGQLKLTSDLLISGYGGSKTIALKGSTAGTGEISGAIGNPHDRNGKATTSITKSGTGTWILSGINRFSGPTMLNEGVLSITSVRSLGSSADVSIASGAALDLNLSGVLKIHKLTLDGKLQPPGTYGAKTSPAFLKGTGALLISPL